MWDFNTDSPNLPLTDSMIEEAESLLGVQLPQAYIDVLREKNGGATAGEYMRLPTQEVPQHLMGFVDHGHIGISGVNGIGNSHHSITRTPYLVNEWQLPSGFVLLDGDGHHWIAFDYRNSTSEPSIVFLDSDSGDTLFLANTFSEFFASLVPHEELFDDDGEFIGTV